LRTLLSGLLVKLGRLGLACAAATSVLGAYAFMRPTVTVTEVVQGPAVEAFEKRFGTAAVNVAAIGNITATRARELGFRVDLVASRATNEVFAKELIDWLRANC